MVRVVFRNLASSESLKGAMTEKVNHVVEKFPDLASANSMTTVTVGQQNSILHAGPQLYQVKLILIARGMKPIVLQKTAENVYLAMALLADRLFEVLHRALERRREKARSKSRKWKSSSHLPPEWRSAG